MLSPSCRYKIGRWVEKRTVTQSTMSLSSSKKCTQTLLTLEGSCIDRSLRCRLTTGPQLFSTKAISWWWGLKLETWKLGMVGFRHHRHRNQALKSCCNQSKLKKAGYSRKSQQIRFTPKVPWWHHNSATFFRLVGQCIGPLFRARSILWTFVVP